MRKTCFVVAPIFMICCLAEGKIHFYPNPTLINLQLYLRAFLMMAVE